MEHFKLISNPQKCDKKCTFYTFTHVRQTYFAEDFFMVHLKKNIFYGFEISMNFCVF